MEAKEAYAEQKAAQLQEQYCLRFKSILFTLHSLDPAHEMPGKASNVNAAVRQFAATVPPADRARYMLTVMDADALVPPAYVTQLEATTAGLGAAAAGNVYAAPVLFEQNGGAVPSLVRVTDYTWGALAMQNLNTWMGVGFPISNYSLSLALAASVDFWDTWCAPAWHFALGRAQPAAPPRLGAVDAVLAARGHGAARCNRSASLGVDATSGPAAHLFPVPSAGALPPQARCHRRGHAHVHQGLLQDARRSPSVPHLCAHQHGPRQRGQLPRQLRGPIHSGARAGAGVCRITEWPGPCYLPGMSRC